MSKGGFSLKTREDFDTLEGFIRNTSKTIPILLKNIIDTVYTEDTGTKVGKSVAKMYLELKAAGLDKEEAMELAKDYIRNIKDFELKDKSNE